MAWQSETQEVMDNGYNSSLKDENCHISENISSAIEPNTELFLTSEEYQFQNVGSTIQEMAWQSETQEVVDNGYNSSLKDENCYISENDSAAIEPNTELFFTCEEYQFQNVGSTIQEIAWQSDTQEVMDNGYNSSLADENCHISENDFVAFEPNTELFLTSEEYQFQNVEVQLKHTQMPAKPVDNVVRFDSCCPGRIQKEETPFVSDVCVSVVNADGNARRHALSQLEQQSCNCHDCDAGFAEACCLEHHDRKHAGDGLHICVVCGAVFAEAGCLGHHLRKHTQEGLHICDICGDVFAQPNRLTCHKRNHTGEKPYKCDVCVASFAQYRNLLAHKTTHTREKPFKCDICGAAFAKPNRLTSHKKKHAGKKPYKCDDCGASFAISSKITCHMRRHTGEKPYKCDVCEASFNQRSNLYSHKRRHT